MADHGTILLLEPETVSEITGYVPAGAGPSGPTIPTTGQIWPRGNP